MSIFGFALFPCQTGIYEIRFFPILKCENGKIFVGLKTIVDSPNYAKGHHVEVWEFDHRGGFGEIDEVLEDMCKHFTSWFLCKRMTKGTSFETPLQEVWNDVEDWLKSYYVLLV